ncbi:hypothetical protein [Streptosporangium roseum]|uniref:hypothetical protein n=1 Tax=Streptosporangium roseum TaxID=2001 RepID=UPI00331ABE43
MLLRCGGRTHLLGLSSGDGGIRWDWPVTDRDVTDLSLQDGVTALETHHSLTLVSAEGTVLYDYAAADTCVDYCRVEALGDAVVVARGGGDDTETVVEVVKVSILWVHPSVEEAKDATENKGLGEPSGWIASVSDEAFFLDETLTDAALIRAGTILVTVEALGDPVLTRRSVTAVARNLCEGPWGGGR